MANFYEIFYYINIRSKNEKIKEKAKENKKNKIEKLTIFKQKSKRLNTMYNTILFKGKNEKGQ